MQGRNLNLNLQNDRRSEKSTSTPQGSSDPHQFADNQRDYEDSFVEDQFIPEIFHEVERKFPEPQIVYPGTGQEGIIDNIEEVVKKYEKEKKI